ncbi:lymphocyte antigen 6 complex locus protein G5b-like [Anolis carolinensis]|uniref:lymphocyte antigen 6 complex locus protein G5b-like n=1 Tax=Anolis carolinensis TaxID=28377 RepID=UPI002F2B8360
MPTRVVDLRFWAFFSFVLTAQALKCHYCLRETPTQGCQCRVNVCFPRENQVCIAITVLHGQTLRYRMEGCTNSLADCTIQMRHRVGYRVTVMCCQTDMCNHWDNDH